MSVYAVEMSAGILSVSALILTLAVKRIVRSLPMFFCYMSFELCMALVGWGINTSFPNWYNFFWNIDAVLDVLFCIAVLAELGKNLLRHENQHSARVALAAAIFLLVGFGLYWLMPWDPFSGLDIRHTDGYAVEAAALVQLAAVLALAGWSGLRGFRWPERELRVASGLGFCAVVTFVAAILYVHRFPHEIALWVAYLEPIGYLGVLLYWFQYFAFEDPGDKANSQGGLKLSGAGRGKRGEREISARRSVTDIGAGLP